MTIVKCAWTDSSTDGPMGIEPGAVEKYGVDPNSAASAPPKIEEETITIPCAQYEAYRAAAKAIQFYADPFAWKEKYDPDDTLYIPGNYRLNGIGDTAKDALAALRAAGIPEEDKP